MYQQEGGEANVLSKASSMVIQAESPCRAADMEQQLSETEHQDKIELLQLLDASNRQHASLDKEVSGARASQIMQAYV